MSSLKELFTFSKRERGGILALLILMVVSMVIFILIDRFPSSQKVDYSEYEKEIESFEKQRQFSEDKSYGLKPTQNFTKRNKKETKRFLFDPNTLPKDSFQLLGISPKLSERILNYRKAGGQFKNPEDLKKIFGFPDEKYQDLKGFIQIKKASDNKNEASPLSEKKEKSNSIINLNTADTTELMSLKGIGSKLSNRIIKFRNNAGGFYSIEQLTEVYGLKPETLEQIRPFITVDENYSKININTATAEQLKNHPYIYKWNIANAIVSYRTKHGKYHKVEDLKKTDLVTDEICRKIAPYLIFE